MKKSALFVLCSLAALSLSACNNGPLDNANVTKEPTSSTVTNPVVNGEINTTVPTTKDNDIGVMCTMEAKICPDGSYVGRGGLKCEFAACPGENATSGNITKPSAKMPASADYNAKQIVTDYLTKKIAYYSPEEDTKADKWVVTQVKLNDDGTALVDYEKFDDGSIKRQVSLDYQIVDGNVTVKNVKVVK